MLHHPGAQDSGTPAGAADHPGIGRGKEPQKRLFRHADPRRAASIYALPIADPRGPAGFCWRGPLGWGRQREAASAHPAPGRDSGAAKPPDYLFVVSVRIFQKELGFSKKLTIIIVV